MTWLLRKAQTVLPTLATETVGEVIKTAVIAVASATVIGPAVAVLVGTVSKDLVDALLARASVVEKKLDRLLREPLLTGLRLLRQALSQHPSSKTEQTAVNGLLEHAHVAFTQALALCGDSREDSLLIRGLDCITLAAHPGHHQLATEALQEMRADLVSVRARVGALEATAAQASDNSRDFDHFLAGDDPWRDKPHGYGEQRGMARQIRAAATELRTRAEEAQRRCEILEGLALLAERLTDALARSNKRMEPARSGSRKRAAHS